MRTRVLGSVAIAVAGIAVSGCGKGATTECVKSKSGEVCAVSEDEAITFSVAAVDEDGDVIDGEIVISN
jgi:hypothetical protein